jgi:hypothetical protein
MNLKLGTEVGVVKERVQTLQIGTLQDASALIIPA